MMPKIWEKRTIKSRAFKLHGTHAGTLLFFAVELIATVEHFLPPPING
jgi:hypothetical protein